MNAAFRLLISAVLLFLITGCLTGGPSPDVTYFQLRASSPPPAPVAQFDVPLMVGPVELSPYVQNPRLVYRTGRHQVGYRELHRWAEPLEQNLAYVLAKDLSASLGSERTFAYTPRVGLRENIHSLRVRVHRFEIDEDGQAVVEVSAVYLEGTQTLRNPILHLTLTGQPDDNTPEAGVRALNQLIHGISQALAQEIKKQSQGTGADES